MPSNPPLNHPEQEPEDIFEVLEKNEEGKHEVRVEKVREALEQHGSRFERHPETPEKPQELPVSAPQQAVPEPTVATTEEQQLQEIEQVLADGLQDLYAKLPPAEQQKFKVTGEQAAREVQGLLSQVKVKVGKVIEVIRRWLGGLPGINKFFVEQEAKIKAEKLVRLVSKQ